MKYTAPEMELVMFAAEEVIVASGETTYDIGDGEEM